MNNTQKKRLTRLKEYILELQSMDQSELDKNLADNLVKMLTLITVIEVLEDLN
jgi:hypothetical protein